MTVIAPSSPSPGPIQASNKELLMGSIHAAGKIYDVFLVYKDEMGNTVTFPPSFDRRSFEATREYSLAMLGHLANFHHNQIPKSDSIASFDEKGAHTANTSYSHDLELNLETKSKAEETYSRHFPGTTHAFITGRDLYLEAMKNIPSTKYNPPDDLSVNLTADIHPSAAKPAIELRKGEKTPKKKETVPKKEELSPEPTTPPAPKKKETTEEEDIDAPFPKLPTDRELFRIYEAKKEGKLDQNDLDIIEKIRNYMVKHHPKASENEIEDYIDQFFIALKQDRLWKEIIKKQDSQENK